MKTNIFHAGCLIFGLLVSFTVARSQVPGGPYLGQIPPGSVPEPFAAGMLPEFTSSLTFSADGLECFLTKWYPGLSMILMTTKEQGGLWPAFDTVPFSIDQDQSPHLTPDGSRLYFICYKPLPGSPYYIRHLWYADRAGSSWSDPAVMDSPIKEHYIISASAASNGNLYLSIDDNNDPGIYISRFTAGGYQEPEKLSDSISYLHRPLRAHIAADESYLVFDAGETSDPFSQRDLAISYHKTDGTWSRAEFLDSTINTALDETTPFVSRDNQLIFFQRNSDTYWMNGSQILTGIDNIRTSGITVHMDQNFPNPFKGSTTIGYHLPFPSFVTMSIYNMLNKEVAVLVNEAMPAGNHIVSTTGTRLPPGFYQYVLRTNRSVLTRKMIRIN